MQHECEECLKRNAVIFEMTQEMLRRERGGPAPWWVTMTPLRFTAWARRRWL